ncbi:CZB domain-containing protein [Acidocella sp.]|uniref:CZB domain-containing protein n=1 Tax=Acidocella sp. TaxID=50710 RepID=UPI0026370C17|nr:CZB domain-containing protein [Acidocella sp.]MDD2794964.1 CZB domain-containing protein [Acidocella sp.]
MAIQILRAVTQHVNYLKMVRRCLEQGPEHSLCCDHHSCLFGKWYDSDGSAMIEAMKLPEATRLWGEIGQHHEIFHDDSIAAVQARGADMAHASRLETAMMQRFTLLVNRLLALDEIVNQKAMVA